MEPIMSFEQMWRDLAPIGRSPSSGGYNRLPFGPAERECAAWFEEECVRRSLEVTRDGNGNVVAWWDPHRDARHGGHRVARRGVVTGSHLDSVLEGGAYDGPLGVVSALAAVDLLRERSFVPSKAIGVATFIEEEGSGFGIACLGSRLMTGALSPQWAHELRDRDGLFLPDAMVSAGLEPVLGRSDLFDDVDCFVELHVEQGRDLVHRDAVIGVASAIWPHGRFRVDVAPNATNAIASRVVARMDARAATSSVLEAMGAAVERLAQERADWDGTHVKMTAESVSGEVYFDPRLAQRIAAQAEGEDWPVIATMAGHDAGVVSEAGIPTAMLFVRNPTGVSHSPEEFAEWKDCQTGVVALADTLQLLAS
jgi:N-carbamoyl-L-amino-acid hydrolase